jgi:hypothetical protein
MTLCTSVSNWIIFVCLDIKITWAVKIKWLVSYEYVAEYYILVWYDVDSDKLFMPTHI